MSKIIDTSTVEQLVVVPTVEYCGEKLLAAAERKDFDFFKVEAGKLMKQYGGSMVNADFRYSILCLWHAVMKQADHNASSWYASYADTCQDYEKDYTRWSYFAVGGRTLTADKLAALRIVPFKWFDDGAERKTIRVDKDPLTEWNNRNLRIDLSKTTQWVALADSQRDAHEACAERARQNALNNRDYSGIEAAIAAANPETRYEYFYGKQATTLKETTMSKIYEVREYVNGVEAATLSDDQLVKALQDIQNKINGYQPLKANPRVAQLIANLMGEYESVDSILANRTVVDKDAA